MGLRVGIEKLTTSRGRAYSLNNQGPFYARAKGLFCKMAQCRRGAGEWGGGGGGDQGLGALKGPRASSRGHLAHRGSGRASALIRRETGAKFWAAVRPLS